MKNEKWIPLLDRVLILRDAAPALHPETGIVLPEEYRENYRPNTGLVVAVGPGRRHDDGVLYPPALAARQRVLYNGTGGALVNHDGQDHLMLAEADIFLRLDE